MYLGTDETGSTAAVAEQTNQDAEVRGSRQAGRSAKSGAESNRPPEVRTSREDWKLFASLDTLPQKAGVAEWLIPRLVVKELVDNALDAAGDCEFGDTADGGAFVANAGDISGNDAAVAELFSVARPLTSTKQLRLPGRGALGNGLRVVAGAVLASGGTLVVHTGGRRLDLEPRYDGSTAVTASGPSPHTGTRVEVRLGGRLAKYAVADNVFAWGGTAQALARAPHAKDHTRRPSVHWHSAGSFADLCRDADPGLTVRQLIEAFDGLSAKAAAVVGDLHGRAAAGLTRDESISLYNRAKDATKPPSHDSGLGKVGELPGWGKPKWDDTTIRMGDVEIPARIEVWSRPAESLRMTACVNRTPCTAEMSIYEYKHADRTNNIVVSGAGINHFFPAKKCTKLEYLVNVQCPYMPITSDGKSPDLTRVRDTLLDLLEGITKTATRRPGGSTAGVAPTKKSVILEHLDEGIRKAGGGLRYSIRQLFYAIRPRLIEVFGEEPNYDTFCSVIQEFEEEQGRELVGIYRDNRGVLYVPHTGEEMPVGTRTVEGFGRPMYSYNKVLYIEKEGFFEPLKDEQWPEKHDCALVTSKGYTTIAVRDLILRAVDCAAESDEPLLVFCVHDADGPGTLIYESLQEGLNKRAKRTVRVINLGLDPWEARRMGLESEAHNKTSVVTAKYIQAATQDDEDWHQVLQRERWELNAMTTPQFLAWLDGKIAPHLGKVVPPAPVVADRLRADVLDAVRRRETERVLREANLDGLVEARMAALSPLTVRTADELASSLPDALRADPVRPWHEVVTATAERLAAETGGDSGSAAAC